MKDRFEIKGYYKLLHWDSYRYMEQLDSSFRGKHFYRFAGRLYRFMSKHDGFAYRRRVV